MYSWNTKVRYSECGAKGTLTLAKIIDYFQDSSSAHSESLGAGMKFLEEQGGAWVLNSWQIEVNRYPDIMEEIEITTWPSDFKGVFGPRSFCMKSKDGEVLAMARTLWVYMDVQSGRPAKPSAELVQKYEIEPEIEMETVSRKIQLPSELEAVDWITVRKYHIDTNQHVNNSQYVQMALETFPQEFSAKKLRVEYKKSAVFGDRIYVKKAVEEDRTIVVLCNESDEIYAVVEFRGDK